MPQSSSPLSSSSVSARSHLNHQEMPSPWSLIVPPWKQFVVTPQSTLTLSNAAIPPGVSERHAVVLEHPNYEHAGPEVTYNKATICVLNGFANQVSLNLVLHNADVYRIYHQGPATVYLLGHTENEAPILEVMSHSAPQPQGGPRQAPPSAQRQPPAVPPSFQPPPGRSNLPPSTKLPSAMPPVTMPPTAAPSFGIPNFTFQNPQTTPTAPVPSQLRPSSTQARPPAATTSQAASAPHPFSQMTPPAHLFQSQSSNLSAPPPPPPNPFMQMTSAKVQPPQAPAPSAGPSRSSQMPVDVAMQDVAQSEFTRTGTQGNLHGSLASSTGTPAQGDGRLPGFRWPDNSWRTVPRVEHLVSYKELTLGEGRPAAVGTCVRIGYHVYVRGDDGQKKTLAECGLGDHIGPAIVLGRHEIPEILEVNYQTMRRGGYRRLYLPASVTRTYFEYDVDAEAVIHISASTD